MIGPHRKCTITQTSGVRIYRRIKMNPAPWQPAPPGANFNSHVVGADGIMRTADEHFRLFNWHPNMGLAPVNPRTSYPPVMPQRYDPTPPGPAGPRGPLYAPAR